MNENISRWDIPAIRAGISVSLIFAVPFSIAARIFADNDATGPAVLCSLAALVGFLLGSAVASWHQQRSTPLTHAILTAAIGFIVPQIIFIIVKEFRGADIAWIGVLFNLTATFTVAVIGGLMGSMMQNKGLLPKGRREK